MSHPLRPLLKSPRLTLSGVALAALVGCGAAAPGAPEVLPEAPPAPAAAMGLDTAARAEGDTPVYLAGPAGAGAALVRDGAEARSLLLGALRDTYRLAPETDFAVVSDTRDERGLRYLRLQQLHDAVPVVGREVVVQSDGDGRLLALLGQPAPELRPQPALLDGAEALARALASLPAGARVHGRPAPRVLLQGGAAVTAFRALVDYVGPEGFAVEEIFASGRDGAILERHPRVYRALSREVSDFKTGCLKDDADLAKLPGALLVAEGGSTMDADARNVYDFHSSIYWYYKHFHGRDSYDDSGAKLRSSVRVRFDDGSGNCSGANAAWIPDIYEQMVYGDGDGLGGFLIKNLTLALDVSAHELTHAVTSKTSDLVYKDDSGALNEAMSDIQGSGAALWKRRGGNSAGNPMSMATDAATWKIGAEVAGLLMPGGALRFMDDPTKDGQSKDYYPERIMPGGPDNGGVHLNSGIANLAHYLLSQGGTHPKGKSTVRVSGISIEKSLHIFYLASTRLFTSTTDFRLARYATAQAAATLYGRCGAEWTNVHRAWDAVGVPGAWTACAAPRGGF